MSMPRIKRMSLNMVLEGATVAANLCLSPARGLLPCLTGVFVKLVAELATLSSLSSQPSSPPAGVNHNNLPAGYVRAGPATLACEKSLGPASGERLLVKLDDGDKSLPDMLRTSCVATVPATVTELVNTPLPTALVNRDSRLAALMRGIISALYVRRMCDNCSSRLYYPHASYSKITDVTLSSQLSASVLHMAHAEPKVIQQMGPNWGGGACSPLPCLYIIASTDATPPPKECPVISNGHPG